MPRPQLQHSDPIIIVGAGAFGLSTSLHLALRGYKNVTVFDRHDYEGSSYDYRSGAHSASSGTKLNLLLFHAEDFVGLTGNVDQT